MTRNTRQHTCNDLVPPSARRGALSSFVPPLELAAAGGFCLLWRGGGISFRNPNRMKEWILSQPLRIFLTGLDEIVSHRKVKSGCRYLSHYSSMLCNLITAPACFTLVLERLSKKRRSTHLSSRHKWTLERRAVLLLDPHTYYSTASAQKFSVC